MSTLEKTKLATVKARILNFNDILERFKDVDSITLSSQNMVKFSLAEKAITQIRDDLAAENKLCNKHAIPLIQDSIDGMDYEYNCRECEKNNE